MPSPNETLVALLHGPDQPGLVARVSGWVFEHGGNIIHADQHRDREAGVFFQRVEWSPSDGDVAKDEARFLEFAAGIGMEATVAASTRKLRVALMVSKSAHCFHELVLRWKAGEFPCEIVAVVSNHRDLEPVATGYGLPFFHTPVVAAKKT